MDYGNGAIFGCPAHDQRDFDFAKKYKLPIIRVVSDKDNSNDILMEIYDLMKWGPTSANCSPTRIIFVKSKASKDRLLPFVIESNLEKTKSSTVTAIILYDINFHDHLPKLFPHNPDAQNWFNHSIDIAEETAFRNGSMQGAYFIIAARALGLDCGPMSGFDKEGVDNEFFRDTNIKSNFLCNLGYGDKTKLFERSPRFKFNEICEII